MRADPPKVKLRCAVYTRKSTEDGLEQEFNSLDAQYEACAAYVTSQRQEGWTLVAERYDDGGYSGGNMERPGLRRLLADIAAGKVDVIVLYKIDRLTRSLADFSKIVEILDAAGASFVSITQAFNTTTSMGRLMLNVLLSFAQFEREVTGERIRDKIAASKRKGIWMGGPVPLGYDVRNRKLVVNEAEAELVRHIMRRYIDLPSTKALAIELTRNGHKTKIQQLATGAQKGGCNFHRGTLNYIIANRIYLGDLVHKGEAFPGEHSAIVPHDLWEQVQAIRIERSSGGARRSGVRHPSLLIGLIIDEIGRPMTPSHARKGLKVYRYYITRPDCLDGMAAWRVRARDMEGLVCDQLAGFLSNHDNLHKVAQLQDCDVGAVQDVMSAAAKVVMMLAEASPIAKERLLHKLVRKICVEEKHMLIELCSRGLFEQLGIATHEMEAVVLTTEIARARRGHDIRLIIPGPATSKTKPVTPDPKLVTLMRDAVAARNLVLSSNGKSLSRIASETKKCRTRLGKLVTISCLAPDIVSAIVQGRQPSVLRAKTLLNLDLPIEWGEQRKILGFS